MLSVGTLRLWCFPDFQIVAFIHSKAFALKSKTVVCSQFCNFHDKNEIEHDRQNAMSQECLSHSSSTINYSIWKMDVASFHSLDSDVYIAFSIFADRLNSIYLTSLSNMKKFMNTQRKLIFDINYGNIIDYCFPSKEILQNDYATEVKCYLYILFDTYIVINIDILSVLASQQTELRIKPEEMIQNINYTLASKPSHSRAPLINDLVQKEMIFKQLFKNSQDFTQSSNHKRKNELDDQSQAKKSSTP